MQRLETRSSWRNAQRALRYVDGEWNPVGPHITSLDLYRYMELVGQPEDIAHRDRDEIDAG